MSGEQGQSGGAAATLEANGLRITRQRVLVLEALRDEPHDATAQQLHERLRAAGTPIGLATIYRTLASLSEAGAVDALAHRRGETCYRLCTSPGHHHHLVCTECHRVVELADCELDPWLDGVAAAHGFVAEDHRLEVTGICSTCR
ncbi:MAG: transcriptional repressor [Candidatus Rokuibacteriota bacterium]|nr:MAG: transcriptional repressor [Candidatus Rokubacteria bacterium]